MEILIVPMRQYQTRNFASVVEVFDQIADAVKIRPLLEPTVCGLVKVSLTADFSEFLTVSGAAAGRYFDYLDWHQSSNKNQLWSMPPARIVYNLLVLDQIWLLAQADWFLKETFGSTGDAARDWRNYFFSATSVIPTQGMEALEAFQFGKVWDLDPDFKDELKQFVTDRPELFEQITYVLEGNQGRYAGE